MYPVSTISFAIGLFMYFLYSARVLFFSKSLPDSKAQIVINSALFDVVAAIAFRYLFNI